MLEKSSQTTACGLFLFCFVFAEFCSGTWPHSSGSLLPVAEQSRVAVTDTVRPTKPKTSTNWPFTKFTNPNPEAFFTASYCFFVCLFVFLVE